MEFTAWSLFSDASIIAILLIVGVLIRAWVPLVQTLMLPASLIAGLLAFVLGPNVLAVLPFSDQMSTYPSILIVVIFACLSLTDSLNFRKMGRPIAAFASYGILMYAAQVVVGVLAAVLLFAPIWKTPDGFGLLLVAGWAGGFGSAAAMGSVFEDAGWADATSLGFTSATVGLLIGTIGGIAMAKLGAKRGHAQEFRGITSLPDHMRTGLLKDETLRESSGQSTVSPATVESSALQLAVVLAISFGAYVLAQGAKEIFPGLSLPMFSLAFIVGLAVRFLCNRTGASHYLDATTHRSISGIATDILIVCGIASISPKVVGAYMIPLIILFVLGLALCLGLVFFVAPRTLGEDWFEKSIFTWGWATGAVATGLALLRIIDPRLKTSTMQSFAIAYLPLLPVEVATVSFAPLLAIAGLSWVTAGAWGLLAVVVAALPFVFGWVPRKSKQSESVPISKGT